MNVQSVKAQSYLKTCRALQGKGRYKERQRRKVCLQPLKKKQQHTSYIHAPSPTGHLISFTRNIDSVGMYIKRNASVANAH